MKLGEIYLWETDKAIGHKLRDKYHVYICPEDWESGHTFLFISKSDYGGDFKILKSDYKFLEYDESYISCGRAAFYSDQELAALPKIRPVGRLNKVHMKSLFDAVHSSETMEGRLIKRICNALKAAL